MARAEITRFRALRPEMANFRPDARVDDHETKSDALPLSSGEQRALDLFDHLQQLRLEIAIVRALTSHRKAEPQGTNAASGASQESILEARAQLRLRDDAVEAVLSANPILKAVHNGTDVSPVECDLLDYVKQRDEAAMAVAKQASDMEMLCDQKTSVRVETARISRRNVELATELCSLADQLKQREVGRVDTSDMQDSIKRLEDEVVSRRKRWRMIKGVVSGVICGSGIDWVQDEELCELVLDPEEEQR